jgi:glutamate-1-semialdehyde 2,1-aminomutase
LCARPGALVVLAVVIPGYGVGGAGAQGLLGVTPDLTTLGKVIGGGLPTGAYGGRRELMAQVAPAGPVYQAGTLSGNPLAVAAGRAALAVLDPQGDPDGDPRSGAAYRRLEAAGARLQRGLEQAAARHGAALRVQRQGSMLGLFFTDRPVRSIADVDGSDRALFARVFHQLLARGVHLPPSPYETLFVSLAHTDDDLDATVEAFDQALAAALAESAREP